MTTVFKIFVTLSCLASLTKATLEAPVLEDQSHGTNVLDYIGAVPACNILAIPTPTLPNGHILKINATTVKNYQLSEQPFQLFPPQVSTSVSFCNVSIDYTHPGWDDVINTQVYLPLEGWNGRLLGTGGGGYATGLVGNAMLTAASLGYAAVGTNGGHTANEDASWALRRPGFVDVPLLVDFASVALSDMTTLGKAITESFYIQKIRYSYFAGCSTGGRQGLMLAQRYPDLYDGIIAAAPAINWPSFVVAEFWPQFIMNSVGVSPPACVLDFITAAAISACDGLDGVLDGVIAAPELCHFDPHSLVGHDVDCDGIYTKITGDHATIALEAWRGPRSANNSFQWYGLNYSASLTALAGVKCAGANCEGDPFPISASWISTMLHKNSSYDLSGVISQDQWDNWFQRSREEYDWIIGTANADLAPFKAAGGKMITYHGLDDPVIFPGGTTQYYQNVISLVANVSDFYRFFTAPGMGHCSGGYGPQPTEVLSQLVNWVERQVTPEALKGTKTSQDGTTGYQPLCPYPLVAAYQGGDPDQASSFKCLETYH